MPSIARLLVANRSEIAVRIFRACKELGITSIAICSEIDRDAFHLGFADEAYYVGETPPAESYLNTGRIVEVARKARADAVHPGYGFLAENPTFAQAVLDAGLIWVGPPPAAIRAMGDKVSARKVAAEAGVPTVPGTLDPASGPEDIEAFAAEHGWPVAIKAIHGGGGRGFRVVRSRDQAGPAFYTAGRAARAPPTTRPGHPTRDRHQPPPHRLPVIG